MNMIGASYGTGCAQKLVYIDQNGGWGTTCPLYGPGCAQNLVYIEQSGRWGAICQIFATAGAIYGPECAQNHAYTDQNGNKERIYGYLLRLAHPIIPDAHKI